jgi:hypothetical protein
LSAYILMKDSGMKMFPNQSTPSLHQFFQNSLENYILGPQNLSFLNNNPSRPSSSTERQFSKNTLTVMALNTENLVWFVVITLAV